MKPPLCRFFREEISQDLVEYTLLLAFIVLCSAAFWLSEGGSISAIWQLTSSNLKSAEQVAAS